MFKDYWSTAGKKSKFFAGTHSLRKKSYSEIFGVIFLSLKKAMFSKSFLKIYLRNSACLGFRWLRKSIAIFKLDDSSFCCCDSLYNFFFEISVSCHVKKFKWTIPRDPSFFLDPSIIQLFSKLDDPCWQR